MLLSVYPLELKREKFPLSDINNIQFFKTDTIQGHIGFKFSAFEYSILWKAFPPDSCLAYS